MSKFYEAILKDIKLQVYRYAPESLKVTYKGEDITDLLEDRTQVAINLINNDVKSYEDALKRALRNRSKFQLKPRRVKLHVVLNDNTALSTNAFSFASRFSNLNERLKEYKALKEYITTATVDKATLDGSYCVESVDRELEFKNNYIKSVVYL